MKPVTTSQIQYILLDKIVSDTSSNTEGEKLYFALLQAKLGNRTVVLTAHQDHSFSSSFLNSSIGRLVDDYGVDSFKSSFRFKGSKAQFEKISNYLIVYESICF